MTIYDIAREAGVSPSTVSRVINDKPGVNRERRRKIKELLERYHYNANAEVQAPGTHHSRVVGILVADVRTAHHMEGVYHIANELARNGYYSFVLNAGENDIERVENIRILKRQQVEAVVLIGSIFQSECLKTAIVEYLPQAPIFMLNGFIDLPNVYAVLSDERSGVEDCVKLLASKGHRNIVFIRDRLTPSTLLKTEGFQNGMVALGWRANDLWIYTEESGTQDIAYTVMRRALIEHPQLNGVICTLDIMACGVLRALREQVRQVPRDVSVMGIDNSVYAELCTPRLSSLDNMIMDSSVSIAHKLIDHLTGRPTNQRTVLYTNIVERETT